MAPWLEMYNRIHRQGFAQAALHFGDSLREKIFFHRPAGLRPREQNGQGPPFSPRVHVRDESRHFHGHGRVRLGRLGGNLLTNQVADRLKILPRRCRRERVAFQVHDQEAPILRLVQFEKEGSVLFLVNDRIALWIVAECVTV